MKNIKKKSEAFGKTTVAAYIRDFGQSTTLHGLPYIVKKNYHYAETLLWLVTFLLATYGATKLIYDSWYRYNSNPTVISLEKDFRTWNLSFPAATVCFMDRLNESRAADYIYETWNVDQNSSKFDKYLKFLGSVTNLAYENLNDFKELASNKEFNVLTGERLTQLAREMMIDLKYHANIFDSRYDYISFHETITEMGICHTFSGIVSNHFSLQEAPIPSISIPYCNYLSSVCYARVEDFPRPIRYYIHSPYELPAATDKYHEVVNSMERDTSLRFSEMVASPELRRLEPRQRQCRFVDEPLEGEKVYSYNTCKMGCRKRMAYKLCGCAPFFYLKEKGIPVCGVEGLACLSEHKDDIIKLSDSYGSITCNCLSQCEFVAFYVDQDVKRTWTYPVPPNIRFRWAIQNYSKTRQKRDIIFGFEDLLVSLGGTAALFLGCSVLSFVELAYFFTLRLFWHMVRKWRAKRKQRARNKRVEFK